jgi:hypothetical protein
MSHYGFGFGIGQVKKAGAVSYDTDAQAFFTATGITDTTQKSAVNQLVLDLKSYNIWTKMKAVYPMVGGSSTTHKYNLVNSADSDAAFRISFSTGWTHSSTGATPNGSAYADTFLTPSTSLSLNSTHVSYYSRVNSNATEIEVGVASSSTAATILEIRTTGVTYYRVNSAVAYVTYTDSNSLGFYVANRTASNVINGWKNGTKVGTATTLSTSLPSVKLYLAALNNSGNAQNYSTKQCAFASIGDGLTDTEAANFNTAVQAFQTTLSRNV